MDYITDISATTNIPTPTWKLDSFEWGDVFFYAQFAISSAGVVGNILVIIAYYMGDLFTVSVNDFVLSLAFADLLAAILLLPIPKFIEMPPSPLGTIYCILIHEETLFWVCIKASIFLIMTISIESATAVRKPMLYKNVFCTKSYRRLISLSVWIMAFLTNFHHYFTDKVDENGKCNSTLGDNSGSKIGADVIVVSLYIYSFTYILPLIVMVTSYALTASRLRKNMMKMNRRNSVLIRARHRVIGVVLIDIIVFFVCITPNQLVYLLECFGKEINVPDLYKLVDNFDNILLSIYVCANPIIYTITNPQFRLTLRIMWERITNGDKTKSHWISNMPPETSLDLRTQNGCSE